MTTERGFTPVFGPNGAVMNSPSITPEMREKIQRSSRPPTRQEVLRGLRFFTSYGILAVAAYLYSRSAHEFLQSSPWWAGAFAGAVVAILCIAALRAIGQVFARWELRPSQLKGRSLGLPEWARWSMVVLDSLAIVCYGVLLGSIVIDLEQQYWIAGVLAACGIGIAAALSFGLRWLGSRLGWKWRIETR